MSINVVAISGNLTRDPEVRSTASGMPIMHFCVAVNERTKNNQTGNYENRPNYIDCVLFGSRAQSLSRYLVKGSKVSIHGRLRWTQWEKDGQKRSKIEVIVDDIDLMSQQQTQQAMQVPKAPMQAPMAPQAPMQQPQQAPMQAPMPPQPEYVQAQIYAEEDIPF